MSCRSPSALTGRRPCRLPPIVGTCPSMSMGGLRLVRSAPLQKGRYGMCHRRHLRMAVMIPAALSRLISPAVVPVQAAQKGRRQSTLLRQGRQERTSPAVHPHCLYGPEKGNDFPRSLLKAPDIGGDPPSSTLQVRAVAHFYVRFAQNIGHSLFQPLKP
jgi:hypothetical protein